MPRLPAISGKQLIKFLTNLGYEVVRQKGSHVRLKSLTEMGEHNITVPLHDEIAKVTGTKEVSLQDHGEVGHLLDKVINRLKATPLIWKGGGRRSHRHYALFFEQCSNMICVRILWSLFFTTFRTTDIQEKSHCHGGNKDVKA